MQLGCLPHILVEHEAAVIQDLRCRFPASSSRNLENPQKCPTTDRSPFPVLITFCQTKQLLGVFMIEMLYRMNHLYR